MFKVNRVLLKDKDSNNYVLLHYCNFISSDKLFIIYMDDIKHYESFSLFDYDIIFTRFNKYNITNSNLTIYNNIIKSNNEIIKSYCMEGLYFANTPYKSHIPGIVQCLYEISEDKIYLIRNKSNIQVSLEWENHKVVYFIKAKPI
jgi:hypothetical protein